MLKFFKRQFDAARCAFSIDRMLAVALACSVFAAAVSCIELAIVSIPPLVQAAYAQDASVLSFSGIDITPIAVQAVSAIGVVISVLVAWGMRKLNQFVELKTGIQTLDIDERFRGIVNKGLDLAIQKGIQTVEKANWTQIDTKNAILNAALTYAVKAIPDSLKHFGIDLNDRETIVSMLEARLHKYDPNPGDWSGVAPSQ
jgi:hypothetical protein